MPESNNITVSSTHLRMKVRRKVIIEISLLFFACVLGVIAGLRVFGIEEDYLNYLNFYESINFNLFESRIEPIYQLIAFTSSEFLGLSFSSFLAVTAIVGLLLKFFIIAQQKNILIGLFFYILVVYSLQEMTQVRLAIAIGFAYFSIYLFGKSRAYTGTFMLLLSVGLHYSCAILIPALIYYYIFSKKVVNRITIAILSISLIAISDRVVGLFVDANPMLLLYSQLDVDINIFNTRNLTLIAFASLSLIYLNRMKETGQLNAVILVFLLSIALGTHSIPPISHRVAELAFFSTILIIASARGPQKFFLSITFLPFSIYYFLAGIAHFQ